MSRRWIQSVCIVLLFVLSFAAVILLGIDRGRSDLSLKQHGTPLNEKESWESALADLSPNTDPVVYVTESGTKYHISPDCSALKRAKSVIGTPRSEAEKSGKELCALCAES